MNVSVIKMTIKKMHAYIVLNISKLQETLSKLSPLTLEECSLYPVPVYSEWFLLKKMIFFFVLEASILKAVEETRH